VASFSRWATRACSARRDGDKRASRTTEGVTPDASPPIAGSTGPPEDDDDDDDEAEEKTSSSSA
jgi:hypothetical protein